MKIQEVSYKLDDLIGALAPDTVLNHIFNNFCIGK
jgi:tRNA U34 5-carboxymethylaminomethyl modifying GTPase MnmE/TrmE